MRRCDDSDYPMLMRYLEQEPVYHTFMTADIERHGFHKEFQTVYVQESDEGCRGIFLKYYNNFIVAGDGETIDFGEVIPLVTDEITTIMGKAELVKGICAGLERKHVYEQKNLYVLQKKLVQHCVNNSDIAPAIHTGTASANLAVGTATPSIRRHASSADIRHSIHGYLRNAVLEVKEDSGVRIAGLSDVDRMYDFLMDIPQLRPLYFRKDMMENRIRCGEGIHVIMEKEGRIIAHGNSAASTDRTVMLGGIGVRQDCRRQGYASVIMERLCVEIQKNHRTPCIFTGDAASCALCENIGFVKYGFWGTAQMEAGTAYAGSQS